MAGNLFRLADIDDVFALQAGRSADEEEGFLVGNDISRSAENASGDIKQVYIACNL